MMLDPFDPHTRWMSIADFAEHAAEPPEVGSLLVPVLTDVLPGTIGSTHFTPNFLGSRTALLLTGEYVAEGGVPAGQITVRKSWGVEKHPPCPPEEVPHAFPLLSKLVPLLVKKGWTMVDISPVFQGNSGDAESVRCKICLTAPSRARSLELDERIKTFVAIAAENNWAEEQTKARRRFLDSILPSTR